MTFIIKKYFPVFFSIVILISIIHRAYADVNPGFSRYVGAPITPEEQLAVKEETTFIRSDTEALASSAIPVSETELTTEIQELARALKNDPKLIYEYVRNHIDYVPISGSINGATGTLIAGKGNDFDQVSLFLALMKASGYTDYYYVKGSVTYPADKVASWIGVEKKAGPICGVFASGGIGQKVDGLSCVGIDPEYVPTNIRITHIWTRVNINGTYYAFDPSFKEYEYTAGINLASAMQYDQNAFLSSAGGIITPDYVQNLNEENIKSSLNTYSSNLASYIKTNMPNVFTGEIAGGREIIPGDFQYLTTLPYPFQVTTTFVDIVDSDRHKLTISHRGISKTFYAYEIYGKRISIFYNANDGYKPELRVDGALIATGSASTQWSKYSATISANTPYGVNDSATYTLTCGYSYVVAHDFEGVSAGLIKMRNIELKKNKLSGLPDTSEPVLGESLYIMGLTWLNVKKTALDLAAQLAGIVYIEHHSVGIMAQEAGYYIDVRVDKFGATPKNNDSAKGNAWFYAGGLIGSAFEHGMIEQLQSNASTSTVKILQLANSQGQKIFNAASSNWVTVRGQLQNYTNDQKADLKLNYIDKDYTLHLPERADTTLNQWKGLGYIARLIESNGSIKAAYIISGDYFGGYGSVQGDIYVPQIQSQTSNYVSSVSDIKSPSSQNLAVKRQISSTDPVEMVTGDYLFNNLDLSLGGAEPTGLSFARSYNSGINLEKGVLGFGWRHNFEITVEKHSDGTNALGNRSPVDAASAIAGLYAVLDILYNNTDNYRVVISALASKWTIDQLIDNAVTVHIGGRDMEYIKLADGSYSPLPGVTTQLIRNTDNTYSLKERFGAQMDFNASNKISQLKDVDGNTMTFTYSGDNLTQVKDAFNRTLTLNYSGDKLASVSDSAGRSVSYGYTGDDLTTYTDPEGKDWAYGYNDPNHPHRMTTLTNPLAITTATNAYDTLGRMKTQIVPRQSGTPAEYKFFFSGYRNVEEEPDGSAVVHYFDERGQAIAEENQLGQKSVKEYDGQNHVVKVIDPKLNETIFLYDGNQNLIKNTNAQLKELNFNYDSQFRLTDTVDPLYHGAHIDYDAEHHPTLSKSGVLYDANFLPTDNGISQTSASYYANGQTETATDGRGTLTRVTYDYYGSPYTTKIGGHTAVTMGHDLIGRMISLRDQVGLYTSFVYDKRNLLTKKTDPLGKFTTFTYDNAGRLSYKIDRNNQRIDYSYTPTGKVDTVTYPDASTVNFTYNQNDDLAGMQDSVGNTGFVYDAAHRLTSSTFTYSLNPYSFAVSYEYDANGNLTKLIYPGNKNVIYTYDELNRLKTVKIDWLNQTATYNYDDAGRLISLINFNGTVTNYGYDNANRLTAFDNKKSDATILASYSFTLDANGNRTQIIQNEPFATTPITQDVVYSYNTQKNRLLTANTANFGYDDEGQLSTGYGTSYVFDYEHRLITAGTNQYTYDGAGNRVQAVRNSVTTRYIYDASGNLLAEADGSNNITKYFIHGLGLMAMVTPANQSYCYHFNAVGSAIALTDSAQNIVNKYSYDLFGKVANQVEAVPQPFKFVGQYGVMTESNGFYYMRARYYDPEVGRFISEDPIGFEGGDTNLMAYVANNPVLLIDPSGLWTFQIGVSTTGGAGAGATYGRGFVIGYSNENGLQFGTYDTVGAGGYGGVSGGASVNVSWSGNKNINDLSGIDATVGGSAAMGVDVGVEVGISRGGGKPSYTGSIGIGGGPVPVEMHGFVNSTTVREVWSSKKGK